MKKLSRFLAAALCVCMALTLVGCNKYNAVLKAFEKEGFEASSTVDEIVNSLKASFEEDDIVVTPHVLHKSIASVLILEFSSTSDIDKALENNETLKGLLKDMAKSDYVNGNCVCVPLMPSLDYSRAKILEIFKNA